MWLHTEIFQLLRLLGLKYGTRSFLGLRAGQEPLGWAKHRFWRRCDPFTMQQSFLLYMSHKQNMQSALNGFENSNCFGVLKNDHISFMHSCAWRYTRGAVMHLRLSWCPDSHVHRRLCNQKIATQFQKKTIINSWVQNFKAAYYCANQVPSAHFAKASGYFCWPLKWSQSKHIGKQWAKYFLIENL